MRYLIVLPLLALTGAGTAVSQIVCPVENGAEDVFAAPSVLQPIALRPVRIRAGAEIARESVALVTRLFRPDRPVRLGGAEPYAYRGDALLSAIRTEAGERRCLRDFERPVQGPRAGAIVACLVDRDGDGAYEAAELFPRDDIARYGHTARFDRGAAVPLEAPVRLVEARPVLAPGHLAALRRIVVVAVGEGSAELQVEHATLGPTPAVRQPDGRLRAFSRGQPKFEALQGSRRSIRLVDGSVEEIGGIRLRIGRSGRSWRMTPLDSRFPSWIAFDCGGSRLRIGRS